MLEYHAQETQGNVSFQKRGTKVRKTRARMHRAATKHNRKFGRDDNESALHESEACTLGCVRGRDGECGGVRAWGGGARGGGARGEGRVASNEK